MKQMKYLKLFEAKNEKKFWSEIIENSDINSGDEIYNYEEKMYETENFEDLLEAIGDTQEIYDSIEYVIHRSYIDALKKYLLEFTDSPFNEEKLKLIFEGKPNSSNWSTDGKDPIIDFEDISTACSNDQVHDFIQTTIIENILFDRFVDYIKEDSDNFTIFMKSDYNTWTHLEIKQKLLKKLEKIPEVQYLMRSYKSNLLSFKK